MFDKWGWQTVGDYRSCSNPHRAPRITPNSQGQNVPSLLAENISITESRMAHLQHVRSRMPGATLVWPWGSDSVFCSPEGRGVRRTYQERPPARASESARLGNVIPLPAADSGHSLHCSSHSCLALSAQKPPSPQVSFTLTEHKVEEEAAWTGDSESQHGSLPEASRGHESEASSKDILANHCHLCLRAIR